MRILVDYRPALRERTGVGEYVHELVRAYTALPAAAGDQVRVFTSSWKDRPPRGLAGELHAEVIDRHIPVGALNYLWHRLEWPPVETLAGAADVVHGQHPLLIPARRAAQIITIHDLFFLSEPKRMRAEIRRDYVDLAPSHARRAHAIVTPSHYTADRITTRLGVSRDRIYVCAPGAPRWKSELLGRSDTPPRDGVAMFIGTLERRKNVGVLLDAYRILVSRGYDPPLLRLVGRATPDAAEWLEAIRHPPLAAHVRHCGYVDPADREDLYKTARLLILPSLDEGFGLPVLEAMSAGVPVVASNRGALPEVLGNAGILVEPDDAEGLANAIVTSMDRDFAKHAAVKGLARAREFSWERTAAVVRQMYRDAVDRRDAEP